mmetsp:Transcript_66582/g.191410  ORF Transcript_66582/g.191410 Transcript_66582/m.191410 type:complete len:213 (+) Transcript_66582:1906-2544(+)
MPGVGTAGCAPDLWSGRCLPQHGALRAGRALPRCRRHHPGRGPRQPPGRRHRRLPGPRALRAHPLGGGGAGGAREGAGGGEPAPGPGGADLPGGRAPGRPARRAEDASGGAGWRALGHAGPDRGGAEFGGVWLQEQPQLDRAERVETPHGGAHPRVRGLGAGQEGRAGLQELEGPDSTGGGAARPAHRRGQRPFFGTRGCENGEQQVPGGIG